jgi:hypothetical protein
MWGLAYGAVLSLGAFAASADVTGIVTSRTVDSTSTSAPHVVGSVDNGAGQFFTPIGSSPVYNNYNSYQVSTVLEPNYIAFANNATIAGGAGTGSSITSSTSIAVTFTNTTGSSITPTLESTILPGGFGFYAGDFTGNPTLKNGVSATSTSRHSRRLSIFCNYSPATILNPSTPRGRSAFRSRSCKAQPSSPTIRGRHRSICWQTARPPVPRPTRCKPANTASARR